MARFRKLSGSNGPFAHPKLYIFGWAMGSLQVPQTISAGDGTGRSGSLALAVVRAGGRRRPRLLWASGRAGLRLLALVVALLSLGHGDLLLR